MGWLSRFITRNMDRNLAQEMEAESRQWHLQCPKCGHSKSVWELGGLRYKASGSKSVLGRCSGCGGKLRFLRMVKLGDGNGGGTGTAD